MSDKMETALTLFACASLLAAAVVLSLTHMERPRQSYAQGERDMRAFHAALRDGIIQLDVSGQLIESTHGSDVSKTTS